MKTLHDENSLSMKRGDLLVAQPLMREPVFSRSVIMMLDVDSAAPPHGSMGLVMNNRLDDLNMHNVLPDWERGKDIPVYLGGPVELERLFVIHRLGKLFGSCVEISNGLFIGGNLNRIREYIDNGGETDGLIRFFLGYSGWDQNQLSAEILENSWALANVQDKGALLSNFGNDYWRRVVEGMGEDYRHWLMIPPNPELN